jgi:hypothetical protein
MTTVTKEIADQAIQRDFEPEDPPVLCVVKYQNVFNGGDAYGICYNGQQKIGYLHSPYCLNPTIYWEREQE